MNNYTDIVKKCNAFCKNTLMQTLQIEFVEAKPDGLTAKMPVTSAVHQPDGVLHGGAMVALAESVASAACMVFLEDSTKIVRGIEISANHVKSVRSGYVYATATALHKGRTTQLWNIRIENDQKELVSLCKLTTIVLDKK